MKKVIVLFIIVCTFNLAYAGHNENCPENNPNCNVPDITGGGDTIINVQGGAGGAGGNANVDLVNKVQNQIDNQVSSSSRSNAEIGDIINKNTNTIGDITNKNINTIGDITNTVSGGDSNSSAKASATGGNANATGGNASIGDIKNTNTANGGSGGNASAVAEGGEGGKADSKATATAGDNKGNNQTVNMKFEDKPDLIDPPNVPSVNSRLADHDKKLSIKTRGSVFVMKRSFSYTEASNLSSGAADAKVENALFAKFNKTSEVSLVASVPDGLVPMGYIYVLPDGPDCTLAQLEGKLMKAVMDAGGSHFTIDTDSGAYLSGSSWNFGFGGGASIVNNAGTTAIAPSGGTGVGEAKSNNEMRPAVMAAVYGIDRSNVKLPYIPLDDDKYEAGRR